MSQSSNICLTTFTDEVFLEGTLVLVSSFLRHNPWYRGKFVFLHAGLSRSAYEILGRFPNVEFHEISDRLKVKLRSIAETHPRLARKLPILYSLEAFSLLQYDRVLKIDSDILCRGDVSAMFDGVVPLLCCPDLAHYRDQQRDLISYQAVDRALIQPDQATFGATFNAGVMLFTPHMLDGVFSELVQMIEPALWTTVTTGHSDSILLNHYFRGKWVALPEKYNYLVAEIDAHRAPLSSALLLHFIGRPKPWQIAKMDDSAERRLAVELWRREASQLSR